MVNKMIFDIPAQIADVSQFFELNPGDVIYTGTCEGVIMGRMPPLTKDWLKPGDVVTVESDQIGVLRNVIADE
jgi:2-keto-4-pentenoate hydratase/2-oxohepta-3-ene-1,7-dioic acid hydratase in catechol pathway